jgi:hypothetical protein
MSLPNETLLETGSEELVLRPHEVLRVVAEPGANYRVALYDGTDFLGYADTSGVDWSFALLADLAIGSHSIHAVVENVATGGQGILSNTLDFVVQSLQITGIVDDTGAIQGNLLNQTYSAGKFELAGATLLDDASITFQGTLGQPLADGQVLRVYNNNALLVGSADVVGTDWTFDLSNLVFADHGFAFQLEDASDPGVSLISASAEVSVLVSDALSSLARGTTLYLGGVDRELDLTQISGTSQLRIDAIELGDLVGGGSNSVTLNIDDVLSAGADLYNISNGWEGLLSDGSNQLRIAGDSGDEVVLTDLADWTKASGTTTFNGLVYDIYTNGSAQLLIEQELSVL